MKWHPPEGRHDVVTWREVPGQVPLERTVPEESGGIGQLIPQEDGQKAMACRGVAFLKRGVFREVRKAVRSE